MGKVERTEGESGGRDVAWEWSPHVHRLTPLMDGVEYFAAVHDAIRKAQRQILIIGWDLHSEIELLRGDAAEQAEAQGLGPTRLADLLEASVKANSALHVRLVIWEANALFALERQHLPRMRRPWDKHPRIEMVWATDAPSFASFHEKIVVIDDRVAFAGGMDLTTSRWDTHQHKVNDRRRRKPGLVPFYGDPYHDAIFVLDGEAAEVLGHHCRARWQRATGEAIDAPELDDDAKDPWPTDVAPLFSNQSIQIARTEPEFDQQPGKRQVERSFLDQIKLAERFIYIETQYLAADTIVEALCKRLREPDGPELVLILPYGCPGRLQAMAMDSRRDELLNQLREAASGGRLGVYWPTLAGGQTKNVFKHSVYVHAKVMMVDDRLLRIGSANLNNRSMGLDTELDVFVQVDDHDTDAVEAIRSFRHRCLASLLDQKVDDITKAEQDKGSLVAAIESLRGGDRTLQPFEHTAPKFVQDFPLDIELTDPDHPLDDVDTQRVLDAIAKQIRLRDRFQQVVNRALGLLRRYAWLFVVLAAAAILLAAWYTTPMRTLADQADLARFLASLRDSPTGILSVAAVLVVLGSVGFPITLLVAATGVIFQDWLALPVALVGVLGAAVPSFALAKFAPAGLQHRIGRGRLTAVIRVFRGRGFLSVVLLRNLPIAPFVVVNIGLGLADVSWRDYLLGTLIGMLPGVALLAVFGTTLGALLAEPNATRIAMFSGAFVALVLAAWLARWLRRRKVGRADADDAHTSRAGETD